MAEQAEHCRLLMRHVGIERAHIVGHSSSAAIALQLALDRPDVVHTLVLMDPARTTPQTEVQAAFVRDVVESAVERYRTGDKAGAIDIFFQGGVLRSPSARVSAVLPASLSRTSTESAGGSRSAVAGRPCCPGARSD